MKKRNIFGLLLLCLWLLVGLLSPVASAAEAEADENGYAVWEMSEDGTTLSGNGKTYYYVSPYSREVGILEPGLTDNFIFANDAVAADGTEYAVYAAAKDGEILLLRIGGYYRIYATSAAQAALIRLSAGNPDAYTLHKGNGYYDYALLSKEEGAALLAALDGQTATYDVTDLVTLERYELYGQEQTGMVRYESGRFYKLNEDTYGYVDHTRLDNTYFDADGYFSYRAGTVEVTLLDGEAAALLEDCLEQVTGHDMYLKFEDLVDWGYPYPQLHPAVFYGALIFFGVLPPAALVAVGLALGLQRRPRRARHLVMAAFGALWLVISAVLFVLLVYLGI